MKTNWSDILKLLSPAGQDELIKIVRQARKERGARWLDAIRQEYPHAVQALEIAIACDDAHTAFDRLTAKYPDWPLWLAKPLILNLYAKLRAEIAH